MKKNFDESWATGDPYDPETPRQKMVQTSAPSSSDGNDYKITSWRDCQSMEDRTKVYMLDNTVVKNLKMTLEQSSPTSFLESSSVSAKTGSLLEHLLSLSWHMNET